ncbi:MAG: hypothetical protein H0W02_10270 [Ktedonobacteraceae bacterium]|nr:hypothetical protein [Ktedonobacteraceae bacterium]
MDTSCPPIEAAVRFFVIDDEHATLSILSRNTSDVTLTVLHETITGEVIEADLPGLVASPRMEVTSGEALILLARVAGRIVATQIYEVECMPICDIILKPRGGFNLLVTQERSRRIGHLYQVDVPATTYNIARYKTIEEAELTC